MIKLIWLNLKQAVRNMARNCWQTAISLFGLVLGIVCLAYSVNWLWNELNYDNFRKDYKQLYGVQFVHYPDSAAYNKGTKPDVCWMGASGPGVVRDIAALPAGTPHSVRQGLMYAEVIFANGHTAYPESLLAVDTAFVTMVDAKSLVGDARRILASGIDKAAISNEMATSQFGSPEKAIGAQITVKSAGLGNPLQFTIGAVVEDCPKEMCNLRYDVLLPFAALNIDLAGKPEGDFNYDLLIKTKQPDEVERRLHTLLLSNKDNSYQNLVPLRKQHMLHDKVASELTRQLIYPIAFVGISLLLLLSALFNYVAILTSLYLGRVREYALRISVGASFGQNVAWLLCEVVIMLLLCLLLSGVAMEWVNFLADIPVASQGTFRSLYLCFAIFAATLLASALWPVWRMKQIYRSRFSNRTPRATVSKGLLLVQFIACSLILFVLGTAYRQMHSIFTANLGFRTENILRIPTSTPEGPYNPLYNVYNGNFFNIEQRLNEATPTTIEKALAMNSDLFENPGFRRLPPKSFGVESDNEQAYITVFHFPYATYDFFDMKAKEGTWYQKPLLEEQGYQVLLNPEAAKLLEVHKPGPSKLTYPKNVFNATTNQWEEKLLPVDVKGILSYRTHSMHTAQLPYIFFCVPENNKDVYNHRCIYVKHRPGKENEARAAITKVLRDFDVSPEIIKIERMEDYIRSFYSKERNYLKVFSTISLAGVVITLLGVLSMILYTLRRQRRAIAIHRVFGADFRTLCRHYLRSYLWLALAGSIIATPPGVYIMNRWLEGYDMRVDVGWWQAPVILLIETALVTWIVTAQVRRAMHEDPARVLTHE